MSDFVHMLAACYIFGNIIDKLALWLYTVATVIMKEDNNMELDFSMVTFDDIIEYFKAIFVSILKIFGVEVDGDFTIGNVEVNLGNKTE